MGTLFALYLQAILQQQALRNHLLQQTIIYVVIIRHINYSLVSRHTAHTGALEGAIETEGFPTFRTS